MKEKALLPEFEPKDIYAYCLRGKEVELCLFINRRMKEALNDGIRLYGRLDNQSRGWFLSRHPTDTHTGTLVKIDSLERDTIFK